MLIFRDCGQVGLRSFVELKANPGFSRDAGETSVNPGLG